MTPAWSVIGFTTLAGAAQGLVVVLVLALWAGVVVSVPFTGAALAVALTLLCAGLGASLLRRDHPQRAWRAAAMWRASWSAREAIVLPAFVAAVALWWLGLLAGMRPHSALLPVLLLAFALWWCTAMTYAGQRPIAAWAHPLTHANFVLAGLGSGGLLTCALAALTGEERLLSAIGPWAVGLIALVGGVQGARLVRSARRVPRQLQWVALGFGHVLPLVLMVYAIARPAAWPWLSALLLLVPGLLAERWSFLALGCPPQDPQHQVGS